MKFGLRGTRNLLRVLHNPHTKLKAIHIAGTNGKGSTASMLAAVFTAAGYKTGLYTSPHLVSFTERIRVNGEPISEEAITHYTKILRSHAEKHQSTFFEVTTSIAFAYFADQNVDIAIVETGLGGRLDSTNVLKPLVSVITNIGLEHTEILGKTITKIAREKAGIIKRETPCITAIRDPEALKVIRDICKRKKATLVIARLAQIQVKEKSIQHTIVDATDGDFCYKNLKVSLAGSFQSQNIALVLSVVSAINKSEKYVLTEKAIRNGVGDVRKYAGIQGRFSIVRENPLVILDVAHNAEAVEVLVRALQDLHLDMVDLVFGVMKDKDYKAMLKAIKPILRRTIVVAPHTERARSVDELTLAFALCGIRVHPAQSVADGIHFVLQHRKKGVPILITGSHYVAGEAMEYFRKK